MSPRAILLVALVAPLALVSACGSDDGDTAKTATPAAQSPVAATAARGAGAAAAGPTATPAAVPASANVVTTPSGLKYIDIEPGSGAVIAAGQTAVVHYSGWLEENGQPGTKFDSSRDSGRPFSFPLGGRRVIRGWDEGVAGMKVGGKRRLIIPPDLGYGATGSPPRIPPNATLIFDVDLLEIRAQ